MLEPQVYLYFKLLLFNVNFFLSVCSLGESELEDPESFVKVVLSGTSYYKRGVMGVALSMRGCGDSTWSSKATRVMSSFFLPVKQNRKRQKFVPKVRKRHEHSRVLEAVLNCFAHMQAAFVLVNSLRVDCVAIQGSISVWLLIVHPFREASGRPPLDMRKEKEHTFWMRK